MTIKKNWKNKSRQKMRNQPNTVIKIYAHLSTKGNTNSQTPETKFKVDLSQSLHFGKKKKKKRVAQRQLEKINKNFLLQRKLLFLNRKELPLSQ